jgi:prevent-host-death family protein
MGLALYDVKNRLTDIVHQVEDGEPIEITRHGKPVAALVGIAQFREMERSRSCFSTAYAHYRRDWEDSFAAEIVEDGGIYADPFNGIRAGDQGREIEL